MHAKKQENTIHNKKKYQALKTAPNMTQFIVLISNTIKKCYNCIPYAQEATRNAKHFKQRHGIDF